MYSSSVLISDVLYVLQNPYIFFGHAEPHWSCNRLPLSRCVVAHIWYHASLCVAFFRMLLNINRSNPIVSTPVVPYAYYPSRWFNSLCALGYSHGAQKIPEASRCKYLGIILRSNLNWVDQVKYTVQKAGKALHFVMRVLKKGNRNTKCLAYTSLLRPVLEYGSACWDPCREGQINALGGVQKEAARFTYHKKNSEWETLAQRRTVARLCAFFKACSGERAWKAIGDRLRRPYYLSRVDQVRKIRDRKQRTDIGKYSFINRTIKSWNQPPAPYLMGNGDILCGSKAAIVWSWLLVSF